MSEEVGLLILQAAIKWGPVIAAQIAKLFDGKTHTLDEWLAVLDSVKTYEQMDAESKARVGTPAAVTLSGVLGSAFNTAPAPA